MKTIPFLALIAFLTGCGTTWHETSGKIHPAVAPSSVKVYEEIPPNSEIIGTVFVKNNDGLYHFLFHPEERLLKAEAARIGATGLIVGPYTIRAIVGYEGSGTAVFIP